MSPTVWTFFPLSSGGEGAHLASLLLITVQSDAAGTPLLDVELLSSISYAVSSSRR